MKQIRKKVSWKTPVSKKSNFVCGLLREPNFTTKNNHFEKSHSAENCKSWTIWVFSNSNLLQTIKKLKGAPLETFKNFQKESHKAEKSEGGPFRLVRFCKCTKKFLAEAGNRTRDL